LKIKDALPQVFSRANPVLDPKMPMLPAVSMLRFPQIDGLPLVIEGGKSPRAIHGYSILTRLLRMRPEEFWPFLEKHCEDASQPIAKVKADDDLATLLETFDRERFGFAWVSYGESEGVAVSLADVLELYGEGTIRSELLVRDVGSPIFSLPGMTPLRQALLFMFSHRLRRVFVAGGNAFVSDRGIVSHIFSPATLRSHAGESADVLAIPIAEIQKRLPKRVPGRTSIQAAAHALEGEVGQCLVSRGVVVTPWDLVIKPWKSGALRVVE
jgi:hypothetical protein